MARKLLAAGLTFVFLVTMGAVIPSAAQAGGAPRISAEVLNALVGNSDVTILDVRRGSDYSGSGSKIKGAVRESEKDISWADKYGKDQMLVLYCA